MLGAKVGSSWKKVKSAFVKVNGAWKTVGQIYVKVSGAWKPIWKYSWTPGAWGNCSETCGGGTQTRTVTCTRTENSSTTTTVADSLCTKFVGSKPATSQSCNIQSCPKTFKLISTGHTNDYCAVIYKFGTQTKWNYAGYFDNEGTLTLDVPANNSNNNILDIKIYLFDDGFGGYDGINLDRTNGIAYYRDLGDNRQGELHLNCVLDGKTLKKFIEIPKDTYLTANAYHFVGSFNINLNTKTIKVLKTGHVICTSAGRESGCDNFGWEKCTSYSVIVGYQWVNPFRKIDAL